MFEKRFQKRKRYQSLYLLIQNENYDQIDTHCLGCIFLVNFLLVDDQYYVPSCNLNVHLSDIKANYKKSQQIVPFMNIRGLEPLKWYQRNRRGRGEESLNNNNHSQDPI